jgi:hypothetical protein
LTVGLKETFPYLVATKLTDFQTGACQVCTREAREG